MAAPFRPQVRMTDIAAKIASLPEPSYGAYGVMIGAWLAGTLAGGYLTRNSKKGWKSGAAVGGAIASAVPQLWYAREVLPMVGQWLRERGSYGTSRALEGLQSLFRRA